MNDMATLPFAHPDRLFIDGEWVLPSGRSTIDVITPSTEELLVSVAEAQEADVNRAVAAARQAFDKGPWPRMSPQERAGYLHRFAEEIVANAGPMGRAWSMEMGILSSYSEHLMGMVSGFYSFYAKLADTFEWEEIHPVAAVPAGLLVREPVGVVAAIVPWNGPPMLAALKVAPALLAGCTVVLKASPEAPSACFHIAEIAERIGLPKGVVNVLMADREVSEHLVRHPDVDKVSFTGSTAAGKRIASICGERIARCTLELGGKSAAVVMDDVDLGLVAANMAQNSAFMTGQVCAALTRVIVPRKRHDDLVDALAAEFGKIRMGDPLASEGVDMGPLAMARQRERVEHYIAKGLAEGAQLATGGGRPASLNRGFFVEPTVFAGVDNQSTIAQEEIFGPVVSVIPADDENHALEIANDSLFGLSGAVFTDDPDRAYRAARAMRTGTICQNALPAPDLFNIAFGGFKQSGIGREGGKEGLLPYLEAKTILLNGLPGHLKS